MLNGEQSVHKPQIKAFETSDTLSYHKSVEQSQDKRPPIGVSYNRNCLFLTPPVDNR